MPDQTPTPQRPLYTKRPEVQSTNFFAIEVKEGWRSWILCTGMYEWAADGLVEMLQGRPAPARTPGGTDA